MVQGLGFLSKKSWHTKNLNNQEKVWIAEQQQEQERLRTTELAKQIQIEREQNEINDITGGNANSKKKIYDRGIDWMYTGQTKDSQVAKEDAQKMAEEYLLGKPIAFHGAAAASQPFAAVAGTGSMEGLITDGVNRTIDAVVQSDTATTTITAAATKHPADDAPAFQPNHKYEDPMYAVSLQTVRKEKMMEQQKELYHKVGIVTTVTTKNDDDDHDNSKSKAQKKSKKRKSKRYDSDNSDDKDERRHRHRKHSKKHSSEYREQKRTNQNGKRKRHHDDDDYDSRSYGSADSDDNRYSNDRHQRRSRETYGNTTDRTERNRDTRHPSREHERDTTRRSRSPSPPTPPQQRQRQRDEPNDGHQKYGLMTNHASSSSEQNHHYDRRNRRNEDDDLGPNVELLQRKREESYRRQSQHQSRRRFDGPMQQQHGRSSNHHPSPEERAQKLRAMQETAHRYDVTRRPAPSAVNDSTTGTGANATFLHEISQQVHGVYQNNHHHEDKRSR